MARKDENPIFALLFLVIFGIALFYIYVWPSIVSWWGQNWQYVIFALSLFGVGVFGIWAVAYKQSKAEKTERIIFEQKQIGKGLVKFIDRHGNEKWGKPEEVENWKEKDEEAKKKESLFYRVVKEIEEFEPAREELRNEYAYHLSLFSWLKKTFPEAEYEKQKGHSRPDIIVEDIAIEIKGPTNNQALVTIADKCMKYAKYYKNLIIVLFEVRVNHERYDEWFSSLKSQFPNVEVIKK